MDVLEERKHRQKLEDATLTIFCYFPLEWIHQITQISWSITRNNQNNHLAVGEDYILNACARLENSNDNRLFAKGIKPQTGLE